MRKKMFDGASPLIFQRAKELRNQVTHAEMLLWDYLRNNQMGYKFRRQHPVGNFIVDFYCHQLKWSLKLMARFTMKRMFRNQTRKGRKFCRQKDLQ